MKTGLCTRSLAALLAFSWLLAARGAIAQAPQAAPPLPVSNASLDPALGIATLRLWNGPAPGAHGETEADIPTLTVLRPTRPNGTAIIVAPGGAYRLLSGNLEGRQPGDFLAGLGVTVFVLRYRLSPAYMYPVPLEDARRAVRMVRSLASTYGYSRDRIGMMGFSAGGHLTAMTGVAPQPGSPNSPDPVDRESSELNFMVLAYPWLNAMQPQVAGPAGPMINYCSVIKGLVQDDCKRLEQDYTPALHITASTPPAFMFHTTDDRTVPVQASIGFYTAMHAAGRDAELHVFSHGAHGSGMGGADPSLSQWPHLLQAWLGAHGWLTPPPR